MERYLTIPNLISASRLPLALLFIWQFGTPMAYLWLVLAIVSDGLDGYAARKLDQQSSLGAIIDPLFDRVFVLLVFGFFVVHFSISWWLVVVFFSRDILSSGAYLLVKNSEIEFRARLLGKVVTVAQFLVLACFTLSLPEWGRWGIYATGALSLAAIFDYVRYYKRTVYGSDRT